MKLAIIAIALVVIGYLFLKSRDTSNVKRTAAQQDVFSDLLNSLFPPSAPGALPPVSYSQGRGLGKATIDAGLTTACALTAAHYTGGLLGAASIPLCSKLAPYATNVIVKGASTGINLVTKPFSLAQQVVTHPVDTVTHPLDTLKSLKFW